MMLDTTRAALLREARLIERDHRQIPSSQRRRGQQRVDGDDTGAADSRRENRIAVTGRHLFARLGNLGGRQLRHASSCARPVPGFSFTVTNDGQSPSTQE